MVLVLEKDLFPEMVSFSPHDKRSMFRFIHVNSGTTGLHHKKASARFALAIHKIARRTVDLPKTLLLVYAYLHDIGLEKNVPSPVYDHVELAADRGYLHQIHGSPQKAPEQTGKFEPINFSHPVVVADSS